MKTIHFFGECMMELKATSRDTMSKSFAGDVYNSAVYLKRCFADIDTSVVTTVGQDSISNDMLARCDEEHINTQFVFRHPSKTLGVYLIETDDQGERSFVYWRSDSAARQTMQFISDEVIDALQTNDMFFFSGIPLAIMSDAHRAAFWAFLEKIKQRGLTIVFDPNYRSALWENKAHAIAEFEQALSVADIALPGIEDFETLYDFRSSDDVVTFCKSKGVKDVIVKNGPASVVTSIDDVVITHPITPVTNVVDTTSAGDAFNGAFLGARLSDYSVRDAVNFAADAAATVIQFPGAIAPKDAFMRTLRQSHSN
ncbi:sugar kinase [Alteromonas halophila]|uniref:Ketodeoxygluconokinase n=1 Tax=Alteromonas halophila TaxID=516698 RepID=A0A918JJ72_9ALTE|nr:sugar kinase [Alteromonas halophila]GGW82786.1 ketodeoxygluconokinase [Alteromonas halophila]